MTIAAVKAPIPYGSFIVRLLIVAGVQLVLAIMLRQIYPGRPRWVTITLSFYMAALWLGSAFALLDQLTTRFFFFQDQGQLDPVTVLALVVIGILVLSIPAVVLVARAETRSAVEPILFAAMALIIGLLCLPAIKTLTRTTGTSTNSGSVTLYVSSTSRHFKLNNDITLPEIGSGQFGGKTIEDIGISDTDKRPFRWVLILRGGARMSHTASGIHVVDLGESGGLITPRQRIQLISGQSSDGITSFVVGEAALTFAKDTISRRSVILPTYLAGSSVHSHGESE